MLLLIAIEDIRSHTIKPVYQFGLIIEAIFWNFGAISASPAGFIVSRLPAAAAPFALFLLCAVGSAAAGAAPPIGFGDIKLFAILGFMFGGAALAQIASLSFMLSGITAALLLITRRIKKTDRIAFGPFIALSCVPFILLRLQCALQV